MTPAEFLDQFVHPAIALWNERQDSPVLAVCAIAQVDILAEVVAHAVVGTDRDDVRDFRDDLGRRIPAIDLIRNAHDSHKHGNLTRRNAREISQGQRPYQSAGTAFFVGHSFVGDPIGSTDTSVLLNDGTPLPVGQMLRDAMDAWTAELARLNIPV
jgi:hypothetical protein